jgi:hypothetical protein
LQSGIDQATAFVLCIKQAVPTSGKISWSNANKLSLPFFAIQSVFFGVDAAVTDDANSTENWFGLRTRHK